MGLRLLLIGFFGVAGVLCRYGMGALASQVLPPPFPHATLLINVLGSFLLGIVYVLGAERAYLTPDLMAAVVVGFLGGFTTFSAFSMESLRLFEDAHYLLFFAYVLASPVVGILAAAAGVFLMRRIV